MHHVMYAHATQNMVQACLGMYVHATRQQQVNVLRKATLHQRAPKDHNTLGREESESALAGKQNHTAKARLRVGSTNLSRTLCSWQRD